MTNMMGVHVLFINLVTCGLFFCLLMYSKYMSLKEFL